MKTNNIFTFLLFPLTLASCTQSTDSNQESAPPNIIVILADDLGYSDIGHFGSEIKTPNLDYLADKGLVLTQFYNTAGSCQTRASLLTGLYPQQALTQISDDNTGSYVCENSLNKQCITLAEVLRSAGYNTLMSGEWNLGNDSADLPLAKGFDRYFGLIDGVSNYFNLKPWLPGQPETRMMLDDKAWFPPDTGFYMTKAFSDKAVEYVKTYASEEKPFFIYLAYTAPHWPLQALQQDIRKYSGKYNEGWEKLRDDRYYKMMSNGILSMDDNLPPLGSDVPEWSSISEAEKKGWSERMEVYAAMVDRMDQGIGEVLNALRSAGKLDNTLIIFLSDNGGCNEEISHLAEPYASDTTFNGDANSFGALVYPWINVSNTPFLHYRQYTREGGISTPFIAFWPAGIEETSSGSNMTHVIDIMPSLVEVTQASYPEIFNGNAVIPMEGISLTPLFSGDEPEEHEYLIWEYEGSRALRMGDYKIVSDTAGQEWKLFDILNDRCELEDLSEDAPQEVRGMEKIYRQESRRIGMSN